MSNPQKENGFTPISNETMEALCGIRIPGEARQCLDVVIRKTYGYQKKEDKISLSQFCLLAKMRKVDVCRSLLKLQEMNLIISKKANDNITLYRFNKDFDTWKPLAKKLRGVAKKLMTVSKKANASLAKKLHTIENDTKENITKENIAETSSALVIPNLLNDKQKHIQIIGLFASKKGINFTSVEHQREVIKRNLRPAQSLTPYSLERIAEVMDWLNMTADYKWTIESVGKTIDENLNNLSNRQSKVVII
jgi:phage replication O-like protein O